MHRRHQRTLAALFAHPLPHGLRASEVEALCVALGCMVTESGPHRLRIRMPAGEETWIRIGEGVHHPELDAESILRLRHLLQEAGVGPGHPVAAAATPRGDRSHRLVLVLDHHGTEVFDLRAAPTGAEDLIAHSVLRPQGVWGSGENLTHRHDRDVAGQRAPVDSDYLARITTAIADADAVLLLGHGTGESDMRRVLLRHLRRHRRDLLERVVGVVTLPSAGLGAEALLAIAREHFGNQRHRRLLVIPGQEAGGTA